MSFLACRVFNENAVVRHRLVSMETADLCVGEVLVAVDYSSVNYKDALACSGRSKIMRRFPLNAGIDLAGVVMSSTDPRFVAGDAVLANGCGLGEMHDGGLAQFARVPADWLISMPENMDARMAMSLGTGGFTAALCLHRMEQNGQSPEQGPIVVTGASGGVGSVAVALFASRGYEVIAVSSRPQHHDYLRHLGANKVCSVEDLALGNKPLEAARFGGVVDNVGGGLLAQLLAHMNLWGNVASVGLAASEQLPTTVFPFILRGVSILGVSSANCPMPLRREIWNRLANQWRFAKLADIVTEEVRLVDVSPVFDELLDRKRLGRTIVNCKV